MARISAATPGSQSLISEITSMADTAALDRGFIEKPVKRLKGTVQVHPYTTIYLPVNFQTAAD
jgi:hypothetical protein